MRYKEDWEAAKKRHTAFWSGEVIDRCCVNVRCGDSELPRLLDEFWQKNNWDIRLVRMDPERFIQQNRLVMAHTYYGGDAFPLVSLDLGASGHAGFFKGAKYQIGDTVWFFPTLENPDTLEFDESSCLFQKTLEFARALAQAPDIYLFDEPVSFLDVRNQLEIMAIGRELVEQDGKTVIMVLHDLNMALRFADHVVMMKEGSVFAQGTPGEVITEENILAVYGTHAQICNGEYVITSL